jgi:hypothetical protein
MQAGTFRTRCGQARGAYPHAGGGPAAVLAKLRQRTCDQLRADGFKPTVPAEALTNHLWCAPARDGARVLHTARAPIAERGRIAAGRSAGYARRRSHTWTNGAQKVNVHDVYRVEV